MIQYDLRLHFWQPCIGYFSVYVHDKSSPLITRTGRRQEEEEEGEEEEVLWSGIGNYYYHFQGIT